MSSSQGRILVESAYAQGKMLDHSGWCLDRGITPSDIDFVIEAGGCFLFGELSRDNDSMRNLSKGQRIMYRRLASRSDRDVVAVCSHSVQQDRPINTQTDILSATIYFDAGTKQIQVDNTQWQGIVVEWANNPQAVLDALRGTRREGDGES